MQLVAAKDYIELGWLFGTEDGPLISRDAPADVERRMYTIATVLQHSAYTIERELAVPGRTGEAILFDVRLVNNRGRYLVPFVTVRGPEGRWFVEQVDLEAVTSPQ